MPTSVLNQKAEKHAKEQEGPRCECGRRVPAAGRACRRCLALDGKTAIQAELIRALQQEPRSCREIAQLYNLHIGTVYRVLCALVRDGRATVLGRKVIPGGLTPLYGWRGLPEEGRGA